MADDLLIFCDAEAVETGFVPTVRISQAGKNVFTWRCSFAFSELTSALTYGRDYAEVAARALGLRD